MKMDWVAHSGARTWRLYFREPTQFAALLRLRDEDGWFEYALSVPWRLRLEPHVEGFTKLEGLRTLEEAQAAVQVIAATNR